MIPRRSRAPLATGAAVLAATAFVALVDPNDPGHYPLCPTKYLTGFDCPGCGGLRSVHALAQGDVGAALDHNAFLVLVLLPVCAVLWLAWLRRTWVPESSEPTTASLLDRAADKLTRRPVVVTGVVAMLAFTLVRNIEAVPVLAWLGSSAASVV